jgi:hypothetical protein
MIRFLKRLFGFFAGSRSQPTLQKLTVQDREDLARFLFSDKQFSKSARRVNRHAFTPPENGRCSVFRISDIDDATAWQIGRDVEKKRGERLRARADISANSVRTLALDVVAAPKDHYLHADIVGWPSEKEKVRAITLELATRASLRLPDVQQTSPA